MPELCMDYKGKTFPFLVFQASISALATWNSKRESCGVEDTSRAGRRQ